MKIKGFIKIFYGRNCYEIELNKILFVLSRLSGKNVEFTDEKEIEFLLNKYNLLNKSFLNQLSDI
ncbi:hypothetical protein IJ425_04325 [bacterium]|nr:hypothetical protein [bacterium]